MSALDSVTELTSLLEKWEREEGSAADPIPTLKRVAELVEQETEAWYKMDPDPFDDRHPGRADPDCSLGHLLKALFKNDNFMNKLVSVYLASTREQGELHTTACRLLLDVMPGLEATAVFQENENIVQRLVLWAQTAEDPLRSFATGLLAGAMEVQDIAANFKEKNAVLVPLMVQRLHELRKQSLEEPGGKFERPFANVGKEGKRPYPSNSTKNTEETRNNTVGTREDERNKHNGPSNVNIDKMDHKGGTVPAGSGLNSLLATEREKSNKMAFKIHNEKQKGSVLPKIPSSMVKDKKDPTADCSNSSWAEMQLYVIGSYCMSPLTLGMKQRLILQYLTPMGEYQELLSHVFEQNAMELIFHYIDLTRNKDVRLAFEALKYLAALLCHKKFAIEFIQENGVQQLLEVYRPSMAATGVSMCLYYLAYFEDAMERVCMLPQHVLSDLVSFVLWLLECSHESGRCHATMFFSMSFSFRVILELFDKQDGLRKLFNVISTLEILNVEDSSTLLTEDEIFTSRQAARHVCVALKKYFEAHLVIKSDQIRRSHVRSEGGSPLAEIPAYRATKFPQEVVQDNVELLLECLPLRMRWDPVYEFIKLGGITLLTQLVAMAAEWNAYTGKAETIRSALDVLTVCTVVPHTQLLLCDSVTLPENTATPAISILLGIAEGEVIVDPDVQKAALNIIINCVCGPMARYSGAVGRFVGGSARKKVNIKSGEDLLGRMWNTVRTNNGIMVLLKLLMTRTPITEADSIRALACRALVGLARSDTVRQIIGKLPLFNGGQLQTLMKEPVLQEKQQEHLKFCSCANDLIERVSGKPQHSNIDASLDRIRRADVVAQTKIVYQEKELLALMHEHLLSKGLFESAAVLQREAGLPRCSTPPHPHPSNPHIYSTPTVPSKLQRQISTPGSMASGSSSNSGTPTSGPIKINIINSKVQSPTISNQARAQQTRKIIRQKHELAGPAIQSPAIRKVQNIKQEPVISLDKIVTEFLRKQHGLCTNPVMTCPPFSLQRPHRCPDPKRRNTAPTNITSRVFRRTQFPAYGGPDGLKWDRKYIYSRFRPVRAYRDTEEDGCFSCCAFSACEQYLVLGTYAGELKLFNMQTAEEAGAYPCHSSPLTHCEPSKDGSLMLTSSSWGRPLSAVWSMGDFFEMKHSFEEDHYVEFSKQTQDRIIGTKDETANIYDVVTGQKILTLYDQDKANNYTRNRANFNPTDELVLNDGVLWDLNSGKSIHKFDKFNPNISGVFHPTGLEIIINSEVWDLRTFQLLRTVPALDQCQICFNNSQDIIYGTIHQQDDQDDLEEDKMKSPFGSSFRTFDATDYSNIATIDVKKNIFDLCTNQTDCFLAVIENQCSPDTLSEESLCRLYEVGRHREEDDQGDEDDEEEEEEVLEEDDDDDDDDDADDDANDLLDDSDNQDQDGDEEESDESDDEDDDEDGMDGMGDTDDDDDDDDIYFELSDL